MVRTVETFNQLNNGTLAMARRPHKRQCLTSTHRQVEFTKDRLVLASAAVCTIKMNMSSENKIKFKETIMNVDELLQTHG